MLRSLWTAASGMRSEQVAVDNIANNIANVNTTAYKSQSTQFKSLLYQTLQAETTTANGETKPTAAQVGLGTRVASVNASFTQGALLANDNKMACAIEGSGFYSGDRKWRCGRSRISSAHDAGNGMRRGDGCAGGAGQSLDFPRDQCGHCRPSGT